VEEEDALVTGNVPTLCHGMVEKTAQALVHLLRRKLAIRGDVPVDLYLFESVKTYAALIKAAA